VIGASSTTTQEAFLTAVRVRMAEGRARRLLADRLGASWPLEVAVGIAGVPAAPVQRMATWTPGAFALSEREAREDDLPVLEADPAEEPPAAEDAEVPTEAMPEPVSGPEEQSPPEPVPTEVAVTEGAAADILEEPGRIRPRIPVSPPKPQAVPLAPAPRSLEAALALAASLPRKSVPQGAPQERLPTPYDDIEMPDGDWG
jgi:hypothetical protein